MKLFKTLEALAATGATIEQLLTVVRVHEEAFEQVASEKREKEKLKKRRQRLSLIVPGTQGDIEGQQGTTGDLSSPSNGFSPTPYNINTTPSSLTTPSLISSFDEFWAIYPRKIGKGQALKAFRAALKKTDAETITAAVKSYPWPSEREFIPHASTWLNGERWADETTPLAKPSDTFRIGHPKGLVKPEPESAPLTAEQKAERARFVEQALKGFTGRAKALGESIG